MDDLSRSSTAPRGRARAPRIALVAVLALGWLLAAPGAASAAGTVKPVLDCYLTNSDGSVTAVIGYVNTGEPRDIPLGNRNKLRPVTFHGVQPTRFESGTVRGAFSITLTRSELQQRPRWNLDGYTLDYRSTSAATSSCPSSTELPEEGNGTGPAIALAVAGVVGGVVVHRANRRATTRSGSTDA